MEEKTVIERKEPFIVVRYLLKKSEKFPTEECEVQTTMNMSEDQWDFEDTKEKIKRDIRVQLEATKEAVKEALEGDKNANKRTDHG